MENTKDNNIDNQSTNKSGENVEKKDTPTVKKTDTAKSKVKEKEPSKSTTKAVKKKEPKKKEVKTTTSKDKSDKVVKAKEEIKEPKKKEVKTTTSKDKSDKVVKAKEEIKEPKKKEVKTTTSKDKSDKVVKAKKEIKESKEKEVKTTTSKDKSDEVVKGKEEIKGKEESKEKEVKTVVDEQITTSKDSSEVITDKDKSDTHTDDLSTKIVVDDLKDFDWNDLDEKGFGEGYSEKELSEEHKIYDNTLTVISENTVVDGSIVGISGRDVIIDIGSKSDGTVSLSEFRDLPDVKIGDVVKVYIEEHENSLGELVLSRRKAKVVHAWDQIKNSYADNTIITGYVKRRTKGGLIVDIFGIESFLPGSQVDVKPIRDFDVYVDKEMEVKVVKINFANDNVIVSHKILIEKDLEEQKSKIINNLEKGQILKGTVKNMTNFGVFIDLGGVDGLLHITDISWGRINHPEDVLNLDDKISVVVLEFDENKKRISLGMKQLETHPWDKLGDELQIGSKVKGKIVNVADYGAFLEIKKGVEGLIHVSEMSWSQHLRNPKDFLSVGDEVEAVVLVLDKENYKMSLGLKQFSEDPWTKSSIVDKYAIGTEHVGLVRNLTSFGLFLELEEGIDGLVHVSDLSWTKKIRHPSEFTSVGNELNVKVLELDVNNRKIALGHKQLEENPWDTFEDVFVIGTTHKCVIDTINDKGALLELPYGLSGFSHNRVLKKEDGSEIKVGDTLDFVVTDFNKHDRRIHLSHIATYREKGKVRESQSNEMKRIKNRINRDKDMSTLGDDGTLAQLKEQMQKEEKTPKSGSKTKVEKKNNEEKK